MIAQILIDLTSLTPARILVGYVCAGVILSGCGLYSPLVKFAGCGATVPLTGFGYALAKGVADGLRENGFIGIFSGGLAGCAGGIAAAMLFSVLCSIFFKAKPEKL